MVYVRIRTTKPL